MAMPIHMGIPVSFEYVQTLNPEVIFVVDRSATAIGGEPSIGVLDNALVDANRNACKNNRIIALDSIAWYIRFWWVSIDLNDD